MWAGPLGRDGAYDKEPLLDTVTEAAHQSDAG
jgi:hypothetical protein